eukprot:Sspe_Gene.117660::Locus_109239_Transcript_1_1_Confidence_1.000_Length_568::g.117660::m.117660
MEGSVDDGWQHPYPTQGYDMYFPYYYDPYAAPPADPLASTIPATTKGNESAETPPHLPAVLPPPRWPPANVGGDPVLAPLEEMRTDVFAPKPSRLPDVGTEIGERMHKLEMNNQEKYNLLMDEIAELRLRDSLTAKDKAPADRGLHLVIARLQKENYLLKARVKELEGVVTKLTK